MKKILVFSAILILSCSNNKVVKTQKKNPHTIINVEGRNYVDYFDGKELNKITFLKIDYVSINGEMETTEYGKYYYDQKNNCLVIKQDSIKHPSGEIEIDSTNFIVELPNDTTLVFTQRIEYFPRNKEYGTKKLNHIMYLKR